MNLNKMVPYIAVIGIILTLVACCNDSSGKRAESNCKTVEAIGGCDKHYCGVKFTDGTFTDKADNPVAGMEMCQKYDGGGWRIKK